MGKESENRFVRGSVFSSQLCKRCRIGGAHMLEMKITAIKSWLLRPAHHLTKGLQCGCPSKQEDYNSQGCSTNKRDEGAGQERLIFSTEVT